MNEVEIKKAQIKILDYVINSLCTTELPELGRVAIRRIQVKLDKEIKNETSDTQNTSSVGHRV
jgi:hypothetical protein